MSETVRFFLVQLSLISVVLILHTYLGLHIIRRVLVFSDLALDQLAALGAAQHQCSSAPFVKSTYHLSAPFSLKHSLVNSLKARSSQS